MGIRRRPRTTANANACVSAGFKSYNNVLFFDDDDKNGGAPSPTGEEVANIQAGNEKLQQQRMSAAQKRMERLQMSGMATSSEAAARSTMVSQNFPVHGVSSAAAQRRDALEGGEAATSTGAKPSGERMGSVAGQQRFRIRTSNQKWCFAMSKFSR